MTNINDIPGFKEFEESVAAARKALDKNVTSVTARQAHEALIRKGLYDNIVNAIAGTPDPVERQVADNWFQKSNTFERSNETLIAVASAIGLKSNDVDNLFAYAATL
jgi:polysaccharide pyruvyl transferase WcaK-like protein